LFAFGIAAGQENFLCDASSESITHLIFAHTAASADESVDASATVDWKKAVLLLRAFVLGWLQVLDVGEQTPKGALGANASDAVGNKSSKAVFKDCRTLMFSRFYLEKDKVSILAVPWELLETDSTTFRL